MSLENPISIFGTKFISFMSKIEIICRAPTFQIVCVCSVCWRYRLTQSARYHRFFLQMTLKPYEWKIIGLKSLRSENVSEFVFSFSFSHFNCYNNKFWLLLFLIRVNKLVLVFHQDSLHTTDFTRLKWWCVGTVGNLE